jgi:hypothetical protein
MLRFEKGIHDTLRFDLIDSVAYVNGKLHQVTFRAGSDLLPLLKSLSDKNRQDIRVLHIKGNVQANYLPWIDAIAVVNPSVDLYIEPDSLFMTAEQLRWLAARFRPAAMIIEMTADELPMLQAFSSLQDLCLMLDWDDSTLASPVLPPLPLLRTLSLSLQSDDSIFDPQRFFQHHRGLAELALQSTLPSYEALSRALPGLTRMSIGSSDSLRQLPYRTWFGHLDALFINQPLASNFDIGSFQSGQPLHALGLSSSIRQDQFDALIAQQSQLQWLELYGDDTLLVRDYTSLSKLRRLEYLTIEQKIGDITPLQSLKHLRFLSVPASDSTDSVKFNQLERALPKTRVTPNGGFCMGTGWILLGIPVMIISMLFWRKIAPKKHQL